MGKGILKVCCALSTVISLAVGTAWLLGAAQQHPEKSLWNDFSKERMLEVIKVLSSDEFGGRAPASKGETLTVEYLEKAYRDLGLKPGNPDGTYLQKVPMVGITPSTDMRLVFKPFGAGRPQELKYRDDFVAWSSQQKEDISVEAPMVFVGYGVVAPEYHWDDYKGMDVAGKVLVMLVNDPPVPDPHDPSKLDNSVFKGRAMTYYGRWSYKYEIAAEKKAAGCLIVHETIPAAYPWAVVQGNTGERFTLLSADKGMSRIPVEGWITLEKAKALFAMAGQNFGALKKAAVDRNFKPVPLMATASLSFHNSLRTIESSNVLARLEGRDPKLRNEYVIYNAHWDHLGMESDASGTRIYHGANDDAAGIAGELEIARAFTKVQPPPKRSILFLSVTAEEQGLFGSQFYAEHPLYPLEKTLGVINMDAMNMLGATRDLTVVGLGMSTLDDVARTVAAEQGRTLKPDPEPEKGMYYRSDHFNFAKQGIPAFDPHDGIDFVGKPPGWGLEMREKWTNEDYHKPSDVIKPYWDLSGAVQDIQLFFSLGYRVANADQFPTWKAGSEFKAKREAMLKAVKSDK